MGKADVICPLLFFALVSFHIKLQVGTPALKEEKSRIIEYNPLLCYYLHNRGILYYVAKLHIPKVES